ncbi:hypothetical protein [Prevotella sp. KH2C16]|uniref:hypothetical protein n=1 Tax=Prevotella sp. KH2C16 TaxID=1855325 RepID=UPI0008E90B4C|nr:hypothetical protein [Prevotella sp. KH2C16]SFF96416.1 hypothetical protein SAMN05216383_1034 [Prevotella sp. KH2C16]
MLVCELGLSPGYVLDEMQVYEMQPLIDKAYLRDRESWEQTRLVCNYIHNALFKGTFRMRFPWDEDADTSVSADERRRLTEAARNMEKTISGNG